MPPTTQVNPGDLITAVLMNEILQRLGGAESQLQSIGTPTPGGTVVVPTVIGRPLSQAKTILEVPTLQLSLGSVLNTSGTLVDPVQTSSASLMVLSQIPQPGTRVAPNTSVDLLVAASGSSTTPQPPPTLTTISSPVRVGSEVTITGSGFASLHSANTVLFDGTAGTVVSGHTQTLVVRVPNGIPSGPNIPGDASKPNVKVKVMAAGVESTNQLSVTVEAPVAGQVQITKRTPEPPNAVATGGTLVIEGSGFVPGSTTVEFDGVAGAITTAATGSLSVTVPANIPPLNTGPYPKSKAGVQVKVSVSASNFATTVVNVIRMS